MTTTTEIMSNGLIKTTTLKITSLTADGLWDCDVHGDESQSVGITTTTTNPTSGAVVRTDGGDYCLQCLSRSKSHAVRELIATII